MSVTEKILAEKNRPWVLLVNPSLGIKEFSREDLLRSYLSLGTLASGVRPFGPFIGKRDMMVMHSLIDIVGINDISRAIFDNASAAIIGMAKNYRPMEINGEKNVALTALGTVQKAIHFICPQLIQAGYQPIIFHATGVGGQIMEEFIEQKTFCGVIEPPRKILAALAGENFVEMEWHGRKAHTCGGCGGVPFTYPDLSERAAELRMEQALRTGAKILISADPSCEEMLSRAGKGVGVKNIVELVADEMA